jgi:hypothetical protein
VPALWAAIGFATVWAILENLRKLNAALNDEYSDSERG